MNKKHTPPERLDYELRLTSFDPNFPFFTLNTIRLCSLESSTYCDPTVQLGRLLDRYAEACKSGVPELTQKASELINYLEPRLPKKKFPPEQNHVILSIGKVMWNQKKECYATLGIWRTPRIRIGDWPEPNEQTSKPE